MRTPRPLTTVAAAALLLLTHLARAQDANPITLDSPDGRIRVSIRLSPGPPTYRVTLRDTPLLNDSPLGLTFKDSGPLAHLEFLAQDRASHDETYPVIAGKSATARDHYNELTISLAERAGSLRKVDLLFRAYDDGIAFRYHLPAQPNLADAALTSENSTFSLPPDATAWTMPMPSGAGHYEYLYQPRKVADLEPGKFLGPPLLVQLPDNGPSLAITEANLNNYPGMCLATAPDANSPRHLLRTSLTPLPNQTEIKARLKTPFSTPWRVILIGDTLAPLIESNLISNLNDPCALPDTSWIKPGKVQFLWWNGYLVGKNARRGYVDTATVSAYVDTATVSAYVDAAAEFGFPYSSIDGLDIAWYGGKIPGYGEHDITVPVPQLDIQKVLARAKEKNVRIRLWIASQGMRKYLDKALETYEKWGVEGVMVDFIERDDQETTNWIRELCEKAAKHHLTVTLHNVPKPTGLSRTYPNLLSYEAVRNQEWDKWDPVGVTPAHNLTVPFTRMLAGPLDYHSGAFRSVRTPEFRPRDVAPEVMGTRCHQLAMYVVYENPMPMAVDYPSAYRNQPGLDLLSQLPTTWDETKFLQGTVGEYITLARRKGNTWYLASMTNDTPRTLKQPLNFLPPGTYTAESWSDDPTKGPNALVRASTSVVANDTLAIPLAGAGGQVVKITPAR